MIVLNVQATSLLKCISFTRISSSFLCMAPFINFFTASRHQQFIVPHLPFTVVQGQGYGPHALDKVSYIRFKGAPLEHIKETLRWINAPQRMDGERIVDDADFDNFDNRHRGMLSQGFAYDNEYNIGIKLTPQAMQTLKAVFKVFMCSVYPCLQPPCLRSTRTLTFVSCDPRMAMIL